MSNRARKLPEIRTYKPMTSQEREALVQRAKKTLAMEDLAWREGFEAGFDYAIERFQEMHGRGGFVRVREIANILWEWSQRVVRPWTVWGHGKFLAEFYSDGKGDWQDHPQHTHESWPDIRRRIVRRDGGCVRCGDVISLEADHIVEVQDGGLPVDSNLQTLCKTCHSGKRHWSSRADT